MENKVLKDTYYQPSRCFFFKMKGIQLTISIYDILVGCWEPKVRFSFREYCSKNLKNSQRFLVNQFRASNVNPRWESQKVCSRVLRNLRQIKQQNYLKKPQEKKRRKRKRKRTRSPYQDDIQCKLGNNAKKEGYTKRTGALFLSR